MMKLKNYIERKRIKFHLMGVEKELRRKGTTQLSHDLKERRERNLDFLKEYWQQEKFPVNTNHPGELLPHIKDSKGTLCAMAYIIDKSDKELVESLAKTNNLVRLEEVEDGPVMDWINSSGLTKDEAAKIQPTYGGGGYGYGNVVYGYYPSYGLLLTVFWVSFGVAFLLLEYLNYRLVKSFDIKKPTFKYLTHAYLAVGSIALSTIFGGITAFIFLILAGGFL